MKLINEAIEHCENELERGDGRKHSTLNMLIAMSNALKTDSAFTRELILLIAEKIRKEYETKS